MGATLVALAGSLLTALGAGPAAHAVIGDPTVATTAPGTTSVPTTAGKAKGSGLWGYAGDVKTRTEGYVFTYGIDVSPADGSLWVTDSAKIVWTSNSLICTLNGGVQVSASACYVGDSRLHRYPVVGTDWAIGQYQANGTYGAVGSGENGGVGANYAKLADAQRMDGSAQPSGQFGGVRGVAVTKDGVAWAMDADYSYAWLSHDGHAVRMTNPDGSEAGAFGKSTWPSGTTWSNRNDPEAFDYPVGITRMVNGNMVVTSQTPELLKEYQPDGTFVRNIYLNQAAGTEYAGDGGYRSPYAIATDPNTGDLLVGYIDPGSGNKTFIQRIDTSNCTTEAVGNPAGSSRDRCAVLDTIGIGSLATGDGSTHATFAIEVEPRTGDIYVGQRSGLISIFATDGTPKGKFSAFGNGNANGQTNTVRGIAFDANGLMYLTVSEGTANTRVVIFARTPDPITGLTGSYTSATRTEAVLEWDPLSLGVTPDAQLPLRDYVIEQSTDGGVTWSVVNTPAGTGATQTLTGLNPALTYQFRVSGWNESGNGDWSVTPLNDFAAENLEATITGEASLTRTYGWDIEKSAVNNDTLTVDPATGAATVDYEVITTEGAVADSDEQLSGEIVVTNPSSDTSSTFTATVSSDGSGLSCAVTDGVDRTIAPGADLTLAYTCTGAPGSDLDRTLTASVVANDPVSGDPLAPVTVTEDVDYEVTEVDKTVTVADEAVVAGTAQPVQAFGPYTWTAEGTQHTENYGLDVTVPAGECLEVKNTAEITESGLTATDSLSACLPVDLTIEKNVLVGLERSYGWNVSKELMNPDVQLDANGNATLDYEVTVTEGAQTDATWVMSGVVTVMNPNLYKSVEATVADSVDIGGGAVCTFAGGATITLAAGETRELPYNCTFDSEPAYAGVNTVTVEWATDVAGTDRAVTEERSAIATADVREDAWELTEFNETVTVEDVTTINGVSQTPRIFGPFTWSAEGNEHVENYSVDVTVAGGSCLVVDNVAELVEPGGSATTQHTLCHELPLSINDPGSASLTRSYDWSISKSLSNADAIAEDKSPAHVDADYRIVVTEGEFTDSAQQLAGAVEITNPNDYRSFIVDVSSTIDVAGLSCELVNETAVEIPAKGSVSLPYRCMGDPGNALSVLHSVSVTGAGIDPISHIEEIVYSVSEKDRQITVEDDQYSFDPVWVIEWSEAGTEHVSEYTLNVATGISGDACTTFTNTASIVETAESSSAEFSVCGEHDSGVPPVVVTPPTSTPGTPTVPLLSNTGGGGQLSLGLGALGLLALGGIVLSLRARRSGSRA